MDIAASSAVHARLLSREDIALLYPLMDTARQLGGIFNLQPR